MPPRPPKRSRTASTPVRPVQSAPNWNTVTGFVDGGRCFGTGRRPLVGRAIASTASAGVTPTPRDATRRLAQTRPGGLYCGRSGGVLASTSCRRDVRVGRWRLGKHQRVRAGQLVSFAGADSWRRPRCECESPQSPSLCTGTGSLTRCQYDPAGCGLPYPRALTRRSLFRPAPLNRDHYRGATTDTCRLGMVTSSSLTPDHRCRSHRSFLMRHRAPWLPPGAQQRH